MIQIWKPVKCITHTPGVAEEQAMPV